MYLFVLINTIITIDDIIMDICIRAIANSKCYIQYII